MKPRRFSHLTLPELLTSLAILALLAAIIVPAVVETQRGNDFQNCLSNVHRLSQGLQAYVQDYDERLPSAYVSIPPINGGNTNAIPYDMQVLPYAVKLSIPRNVAVFACPADHTHVVTDANFAVWNGAYGTPPYRRRSYLYAGAISTQARAESGQSQPDPNTGMSQWGQGNTLAVMDSPAETIALVEGWGVNESGDSEAYVVGSPWGSLFSSCDTWKLPGRNKPPQNALDQFAPCAERFNHPNVFPAAGHNDLGNYAFADGHAATRSYEQVRGNDFRLFKLQK